MAILAALLSFVTRQLGRVVTTMFGWSTTMLFGRVPPDRKLWISISTLGALVWLVVLIGLVFPAVGTLLLAFVPLPSWVDQAWVRLAMLVAAIIIPLLVGAVGRYKLTQKSDRKQSGLVVSLLRGYQQTAALAVTLVMMFVFVPFVKIPAIVKRWASEDLPAMVEPAKAYERVVRDARGALEAGKIETRRQRASFLLRLPPQVLAVLSGGPMEKITAANLTTLVSREHDLEVIIYPSAMMVRGEPKRAARAKSLLVRCASFTSVYLTWDPRAQELEAKLNAIWQQLSDQPGEADGKQVLDQLQGLEERFDRTDLDFEEWETLHRKTLQIKEKLLLGGPATAEHPAPAAARSNGVHGPDGAEGWVDRLVAGSLVGAGLGYALARVLGR